MHIGTFTSEGTWKAAERELPELAELGVSPHLGSDAR
jgi:1,4-alpha-glucan branching enzyme